MGHSIDFHAGALAPDQPMRTIAPGRVARLPVHRDPGRHLDVPLLDDADAAHIANGMYGAVVIDPPDLPPVDRSYVLVQSELYLGPAGRPVDVDKMHAEQPDAVVFNGYADQYDHRRCARAGRRAGADLGARRRAQPGRRVPRRRRPVRHRLREGAYLLRPAAARRRRPGARRWPPAQGGFVELSFAEPGHYPFVSHVMVDAERGAHGVFEVTHGQRERREE